MRVNLLVEEKQGVVFDYLRVIITLAILITLFAIAILQFNLVNTRNVLETEIKGIEDQLAFYLPKEAEYKRYESLIEEIKSTPAIPDYIWDGPVEAMGYLTPLRGVIDNFSLNNRSLNIRGRTKIAEELRELTINLSESEYFNNVNLQTMEKQEEVRFTITAELVEKESE
jgi:type IV pilus assembly protein PilN